MKNLVNESEICSYIFHQKEKFGYKKLIEIGSYGDLIGFSDKGKDIIELEIYTHNFISHQHDPEIVDVLIALKDNEERFREWLPPKVIIIDNEDFTKWYKEYKKKENESEAEVYESEKELPKIQCNNCGKLVTNDSIFCERCGKKVRD